MNGAPRPDHGPGWYDRECPTCGATSVAHTDDGDWCWWCERRADTVTARIRQELLFPPQLRTSAGHPRYDQLDTDSQAVWDRTRGHTAGADSLTAWIRRLVAGVNTNTITASEARKAIERTTRDRTAQ